MEKNESKVSYILKFVVIIFFGVFISCTSTNTYPFYILFDNVEGIDNKSIVTSKGLEIGKVIEMKLYKQKVIVKIEIKNNVKISKNAKISIIDRGVLSKCIDIDDNYPLKDLIKNNDTVNGFVKIEDNIFTKIHEFNNR